MGGTDVRVHGGQDLANKGQVGKEGTELQLLIPDELGLNFGEEGDEDHSRYYDPDLDGLTQDEKSWFIIEKGFKQIKTFLKSLELEDYYDNFLSEGIMIGTGLWILTEEKLEEMGIIDNTEKEKILNGRYQFLAQPDIKFFIPRYGEPQSHWGCAEAAVFIKERINWPVFHVIKENMKEMLPTTHAGQWSIPDQDKALFSTEGRWATASSCDGMIMLWTVDHASATPPCVRCVQAHFDICTDHVTDWDRMMTVSVGGDHHIAIVDLQSSKIVTKIKNDAGLSLAEQFVSCDADLTAGQVVMGAIEGQLKVADVESGKFFMYLKGHEDAVRDVRADWRHKEVVSLAWDRTMKVWDLRSGTCARTLHGHNRVPSKMDVSFDLQMALSCSHEEKSILWDLRHGGAVSYYDNWCANDVCVDWDGMRFAGCGDSDMVLIWDMEQGKILQQIDAWDSINAQSIDVDWKRDQVLLGTWDNQVLVFDLETEEILKTCKKALRTVTKVRFNDPPAG